MLCPHCGTEKVKGYCEQCSADWDQAMDDLFDVLDQMQSKEAYNVVGRSLFKSFDDIVESDDLRG
jgi:hypothetical protein